MTAAQHQGLTQRVIAWLKSRPAKADRQPHTARSGKPLASDSQSPARAASPAGPALSSLSSALDLPNIGETTAVFALNAEAEHLADDAAAASFDTLLSQLNYLDESDIRRIRDAYRFADQAHLGQFRASGEPYITHPLAVAVLCAGWRLDAQAIMAALMHDAMEDCGVTKIELLERFGPPTAELVDGLTKLDKLQFSTREEGQAESFRKMLLAMARDVRVILIKLADRLHNMRTLGAMASNKRARIARETLEIYAPIAHRLGLNRTYRELQDLSFQAAHPWRYAALSKAVLKARGYRRDIVDRIATDVKATFKQHDLAVDVHGREKEVFSIYRKMRDKHLSFAQVSDVFGFRVVVPHLIDCYRAMGLLHQLYKPVPGRFKDYVAIPKANGYQSLHTTLVNPVGTAVEFQIRTLPMHEVAEQGIAAHWLYKSKGSHIQDAQRMGTMWLQSLLDIQDETRDANEFLEHVKIDLFPDSVYVFTPKSKILALPKGATPVDFAYAIHTDLGDRVVASRINGEPAALSAVLRSGDVVEVLTSDNAQPNPAWIQFVRTGRARSKIRHYLKNMEVSECESLGLKMLRQALRLEGFALSLQEQDDTGLVWSSLIRWSGSRSRNELLYDIGVGKKMASIVAKRMAHFLLQQGQRPDPVLLSTRYFSDKDSAPSGQVVLDGSEGASVELCPDCRPIPGDELIGHLGRGEGLQVHRRECLIGKKLVERAPEQYMEVQWAEQPSRQYETHLELLVRDGKGVLAQVASAVAAAEADITHLDMGTRPATALTELRLLVQVRDRHHLAEVMRQLKRAASVLKVGRPRT